VYWPGLLWTALAFVFVVTLVVTCIRMGLRDVRG